MEYVSLFKSITDFVFIHVYFYYDEIQHSTGYFHEFSPYNNYLGAM